MEEQLKANALLMKEYETSFQQKLIDAKKMEEEVCINLKIIFSHRLFYILLCLIKSANCN